MSSKKEGLKYDSHKWKSTVLQIEVALREELSLRNNEISFDLINKTFDLLEKLIDGFTESGYDLVFRLMKEIFYKGIYSKEKTISDEKKLRQVPYFVFYNEEKRQQKIIALENTIRERKARMEDYPRTIEKLKKEVKEQKKVISNLKYKILTLENSKKKVKDQLESEQKTTVHSFNEMNDVLKDKKMKIEELKKLIHKVKTIKSYDKEYKNKKLSIISSKNVKPKANYDYEIRTQIKIINNLHRQLEIVENEKLDFYTRNYFDQVFYSPSTEGKSAKEIQKSKDINKEKLKNEFVKDVNYLVNEMRRLEEKVKKLLEKEQIQILKTVNVSASILKTPKNVNATDKSVKNLSDLLTDVVEKEAPDLRVEEDDFMKEKADRFYQQDVKNSIYKPTSKYSVLKTLNPLNFQNVVEISVNRSSTLDEDNDEEESMVSKKNFKLIHREVVTEKFQPKIFRLPEKCKYLKVSHFKYNHLHPHSNIEQTIVHSKQQFEKKISKIFPKKQSEQILLKIPKVIKFKNSNLLFNPSLFEEGSSPLDEGERIDSSSVLWKLYCSHYGSSVPNFKCFRQIGIEDLRNVIFLVLKKEYINDEKLTFKNSVPLMQILFDVIRDIYPLPEIQMKVYYEFLKSVEKLQKTFKDVKWFVKSVTVKAESNTAKCMCFIIRIINEIWRKRVFEIKNMNEIISIFRIIYPAQGEKDIQLILQEFINYITEGRGEEMEEKEERKFFEKLFEEGVFNKKNVMDFFINSFEKGTECYCTKFLNVSLEVFDKPRLYRHEFDVVMQKISPNVPKEKILYRFEENLKITKAYQIDCIKLSKIFSMIKLYDVIKKLHCE